MRGEEIISGEGGRVEDERGKEPEIEAGENPRGVPDHADVDPQFLRDREIAPGSI